MWDILITLHLFFTISVNQCVDALISTCSDVIGRVVFTIIQQPLASLIRYERNGHQRHLTAGITELIVRTSLLGPTGVQDVR